MPNKTYSPGTVVDSGSLNDFNQVTYSILGDGTTAPMTKAAARVNLGLGNLAEQSAGSVAITGGTLTNVALSGSTANTPPPLDSDTSIATTAFVRQALTSTPAMSARLGGAVDQILTNAVLTPVVLNTVALSQPSGMYNTTNGRFTPTVAGWWLISVTSMANYSTATGWDALYTSIMKNGVELARLGQDGVLTNLIIARSGTALVQMNGTTDYLQLAIYGDTNTNVPPYANADLLVGYNQMHAVLIAPTA